LKPALFEYEVPDTVEEALALLAEHGDESRPLAGGQSLVPMMAFRLARPSVLIDLNRIPSLATISNGDSSVRFGAMVRERAAERSDIVASRLPLMARALPLIGHEAIRTRGTIGGSLAHGDPAGELPSVAVASGAVMLAASAGRGIREIPAEEFFISHFTTALEPDELLTEVRFPVSGKDTGAAFEEMARRHGDFAIVGVAVQLRADGDVIHEARVVLTGVAEVPHRSVAAESVLVGSAPGTDLFDEAGAAAAAAIDPPADLHGSVAYRRRVACTLIVRALQGAARQLGVGA
jgi:CO/xanthine dehydrogenase FAD-binding subunit